ncbi:MAG: hypothetical protein ACREQI_02400 [Candidatus Binataceae bacterium]
MATKSEISRVMAALARKRAKALTPERRREIAAMGGKARSGQRKRRGGIAPASAAVPAAGAGGAVLRQMRETETNFFNENPEIFDPLAGELVIIEGERLVAHGYDGAQLAAAARRQGIRGPFILRVDPRRGKNVGRLGI